MAEATGSPAGASDCGRFGAPPSEPLCRVLDADCTVEAHHEALKQLEACTEQWGRHILHMQRCMVGMTSRIETLEGRQVCANCAPTPNCSPTTAGTSGYQEGSPLPEPSSRCLEFLAHGVQKLHEVSEDAMARLEAHELRLDGLGAQLAAALSDRLPESPIRGGGAELGPDGAQPPAQRQHNSVGALAAELLKDDIEALRLELRAVQDRCDRAPRADCADSSAVEQLRRMYPRDGAVSQGAVLQPGAPVDASASPSASFRASERQCGSVAESAATDEPRRPAAGAHRSSERLASIKQDVEALAATFRATKLQAPRVIATPMLVPREELPECEILRLIQRVCESDELSLTRSRVESLDKEVAEVKAAVKNVRKDVEASAKDDKVIALRLEMVEQGLASTKVASADCTPRPQLAKQSTDDTAALGTTLGIDELRGVGAVQCCASPSSASVAGSVASWFAGPGRPEDAETPVRRGPCVEQPRLVSEAVTTRLTRVERDMYAIARALRDLRSNVRQLEESGAPAAVSSSTSSTCSEDLQTLVASAVASEGASAIERRLEELEAGMTGLQHLDERSSLLAMQIGACTERVSSVDNQLAETRRELQALLEVQAEEAGGADGAAEARAELLAASVRQAFKDVTTHLGSEVEGLQSDVRALHEKAQATPDIQKVASELREVFQGAMSRLGSELEALQVEVGSLLKGSGPLVSQAFTEQVEALRVEVHLLQEQLADAPDLTALSRQMKEVIQDVLPRVIEREEAIEQELAQAKKAIDGARVAAEADSRDLMRNLSAHLESMEGAIARKRALGAPSEPVQVRQAQDAWSPEKTGHHSMGYKANGDLETIRDLNFLKAGASPSRALSQRCGSDIGAEDGSAPEPQRC